MSGARMTASARKATAVRLRLLFTEAEVKIVQMAGRRVWDAIAPDMFQALADSGQRTPTMRRRDVLEVVCDAGRLADEITSYGGQSRSLSGSLADGVNFRDLAKRVDDLPGGDTAVILRPVFPHEYYG